MSTLFLIRAFSLCADQLFTLSLLLVYTTFQNGDRPGTDVFTRLCRRRETTCGLPLDDKRDTRLFSHVVFRKTDIDQLGALDKRT